MDAVYHAPMDESSPGISEHVYTPSELNQEVKLHLEAGFPRILLEAEISNFSRPASGHWYFSLKDEGAQVRCAMFRMSTLRCSLRPENGQKVLARGRISLYEPRGEYQFIVDSLRDAGAGLLQQKFELLKKKLEAEGLFDPARKRGLPAYPLRIGLITSASGAAIQDMRQVLRRRWPIAKLRVYAVSVQGAEAPREIVAALNTANRENWAQVLLVGRGGGSLEDLQAFNEETVARAVVASNIPVVSAVGHETDFSITDFVADLRAPTPSAAAELTTPDQAQVHTHFARHERMLISRMQGKLQKDSQRLDYLSHRLAQRDPALRLREQKAILLRQQDALHRALRTRLRGLQQEVIALATRVQLQHPVRQLENHRHRVLTNRLAIGRALKQLLTQERKRLQDLGRTLHAVSPLATLGRGYAVITSVNDDRVISSARQVDAGDTISAQLRDGRLACKVLGVHAETLSVSADGEEPARKQ